MSRFIFCVFSLSLILISFLYADNNTASLAIWPLWAILAAAGAAKSELVDRPQQARQAQMEAYKTKLSGFTKSGEQGNPIIPTANALSGALQGGALGLALGNPAEKSWQSLWNGDSLKDLASKNIVPANKMAEAVTAASPEAKLALQDYGLNKDIGLPLGKETKMASYKPIVQESKTIITPKSVTEIKSTPTPFAFNPVKKGFENPNPILGVLPDVGSIKKNIVSQAMPDYAPQNPIMDILSQEQAPNQPMVTKSAYEDMMKKKQLEDIQKMMSGGGYNSPYLAGF